VVGADCLSKDNKAAAWATFLSSGSAYAAEFQAEIERVKALRASALAAAGLTANPPASELFDTATVGFGAGVKKLHHAIFEAIGSLEAKAMEVRAAALRPDDQRKLAFEQSGACPFSNTLFTGTPSRWLRFTNLEFHVSVQSKLGAPLTCLSPLIGCALQSSSTGNTPRVEPFGNTIKKLKSATGGGTTQNHNSFVDSLSYWLGARSSVPLRGGKCGKPRTCKGIFAHLTGYLHLATHGSMAAVPEKHRKSMQKIVPDLVIDGRFLRQNMSGPGFNALGGMKSMIDVKTKSCDDKYAACHDPTACAVVNKRQAEATATYRKRARDIDDFLLAKGASSPPPGAPGPFEAVLDTYGRVLAPVVGAFAEMSSDVGLLTDLVASALAADHCEYYEGPPSAVKGMFLTRTRRSLGLTAHRGWARLLTDRMDSLVVRPEQTQAPGPSWGSTKVSIEDDEAMEEFLHHHPPSGFDSGPHAL
jgi:hypothetical protein